MHATIDILDNSKNMHNTSLYLYSSISNIVTIDQKAEKQSRNYRFHIL